MRTMIGVGAYLGEKLRFERKLRVCHAQTVALWNARGPVPSWGAETCLSEKIRREKRLEQHINHLRNLIDRRAADLPPAWREDLLRTARAAAQDCVGLSPAALNLLFNDEALEATRQFIDGARAFDPAISEANIMQAMRNVWVAQSIQSYFGFPLCLSPALFAYSMLYPWTDNCLDDARRSPGQKARFCDWLGARLQGREAPPANLHMEQVSRLVRLIEDCFPRASYPEVYLSLLAIHHAQTRSMAQQNVGNAPDEETILDITIAKGGASVLVDACLLRGYLDEPTSVFAFEYGVCLQLLDDLQDLKTDLQNQHTTLFTSEVDLAPLDNLACRLWGFLQRVLEPGGDSGSSRTRQLKVLIRTNSRLLLLQAVAKNREFFTPQFVEQLEGVSPLRFAYLAEREKGLASEFAGLVPTLGRRRETARVAAQQLIGLRLQPL